MYEARQNRNSTSHVISKPTKQKNMKEIAVRSYTAQLIPKIQVGQVTRKLTPEEIIKKINEKLNDKIGYEFTKTHLGAMELMKDNATYKSLDEFVEKKEKDIIQYIENVKKSQKAKERGDRREAIAAQIIGGEVNRGQNGKDVEWRFIRRAEADKLKKLLPNDDKKEITDKTLFENWKIIINKKEELQNIESTPIDAFSSKKLALVGGISKFNTDNKLKDDTIKRINELKKLAYLLEYTPVYVFDESVSCNLCRKIYEVYKIEVIHLGEKQDEYSEESSDAEL